MHVFSDDEEVVIANDAIDAKRALEEYVNTGRAGAASPFEHPAEVEFEQWADDKVFTVREYGDNAQDTTMTCAEWVKLHGRGVLCSLEY